MKFACHYSVMSFFLKTVLSLNEVILDLICANSDHEMTANILCGTIQLFKKSNIYLIISQSFCTRGGPAALRKVLLLLLCPLCVSMQLLRFKAINTLISVIKTKVAPVRQSCFVLLLSIQ